jgi:hypothetical protein
VKVIIFGASGMVGAGALLEALDDARVEHVLTVGRKPTDIHHAKLEEYQAVYDGIGLLYPMLRRLLPGAVTNTVTLGRALLRVATDGYPSRVLEGRDINAAGDPA